MPEPERIKWLEINTKYSKIWPVITKMREEDQFEDRFEWDGIPNKYEEHFSPNPGKGDK